MKNITIQRLSMITALVLMASCGAPQPNIKSDPSASTTIVKNNRDRGHSVTRDDTIKDIAAGKELSLPYKYKSDTSFKDLTMLVSFDNIETKYYYNGEVSAKSAGQKGADIKLSYYLQTKLGNSKRFTVWSKFGDGTVALAKDLADLGEVDPSNIESLEPPQIDVFCNAQLLLSRRSFEKNDGTDRVHYTVDIIIALSHIHPEKKLMVQMGKAMEFTGKTEELKIIVGVEGNRVGGVNLDQETQAIRDAALDALKNVYYELGNRFPISGEITGISTLNKDRMQFNRGSEQGVQKRQQLTLWYDDGGADIPVAYAEAQPGENDTAVVVLGWVAPKGSEQAYRALKEQILSPGWIKQSGNKLYCTSNGLAPPEEWENPVK